MIVSTKGRYALRVMVDLAEQASAEFVPLKDIAHRQAISQKYIESIMTLLSKNGFVEAAKGRFGGYRLNKNPKEYKIGDILRLTEGSLAPVACLETGAKKCERSEICRTLPLWKELDKRITEYLDSVTIADLCKDSL